MGLAGGQSGEGGWHNRSRWDLLQVETSLMCFSCEYIDIDKDILENIDIDIDIDKDIPENIDKGILANINKDILGKKSIFFSRN